MDNRKQLLNELTAIIRRRCPRIAKDPNEFPHLYWCAEHLVLSFEKAEEAVFHSRHQETVNSILRDLQSAIRGIEGLTGYNKSYLIDNFIMIDGDPSFAKPAIIGIGTTVDREELFAYRLRNLQALQQTVRKLNNRLRIDKDEDGNKLFSPPIKNQTPQAYQAAMLAGGCRKIWHLEKQKEKPIRLNGAREHPLRDFIDEVFDAFGLNDHVFKDNDCERLNAPAALDSFNKLTKNGKGIAL